MTERTCRKVCEPVEKWSEWVGLRTGLPSCGPCEIRPHPANSTAIFKLCDRPARWATHLGNVNPRVKGEHHGIAYRVHRLLFRGVRCCKGDRGCTGVLCRADCLG